MVKFPGGTQTRGYGALFNSMAYVGQNGVRSGCQVTENSPIDMSVLVSTGEVYFGSSTISVTGTSVSIDSNATSFERIDVLRINNSGVVSVVKGTPASLPLSPEYDPDNYVAIGVIRVLSGVTGIPNSRRLDARTLNTSGGASGTSFTGLSDTPSTMVGQAGKIPFVNSGETALEFLPVNQGVIGKIEDWAEFLGATEDVDTNIYGSHSYDGEQSYRVGKVFTGQDLIDLGIGEGLVFAWSTDVRAFELDGNYPFDYGAVLYVNPTTTTPDNTVSGVGMGSYNISYQNTYPNVWYSSGVLNSTPGVFWDASSTFVLAYHRDGVNTSNDGYTQFKDFTTYTPLVTLPFNYVRCNGQTLVDPDSPLNGVVIPNLNESNYFMRADYVSGKTGGTSSHNHTTQFTYGVDNSGIGYRSTQEFLTTSTTAHIPPYYSVVKIMQVK